MGFVSERARRIESCAEWLECFLGTSWVRSAVVKAGAAAEGFCLRDVRDAAELIGVEYARTPTCPSFTLWGNGGEALACAQEQEDELEREPEQPEPEPEQDAVARFVAIVDAAGESAA